MSSQMSESDTVYGTSRGRARQPYRLGDDTRPNCWLCDRNRGELCHVHDDKNEDDSEALLSWSVGSRRELR